MSPEKTLVFLRRPEVPVFWPSMGLVGLETILYWEEEKGGEREEEEEETRGEKEGGEG